MTTTTHHPPLDSETDLTRPFETTEPAHQHRPTQIEVPSRTEPDRSLEGRLAGAGLALGIDAVLCWSTDTLSRLVGLGQWRSYIIDHDGDLAIASRHVLERCAGLDDLADEFPQLITRLRDAARAAAS